MGSCLAPGWRVLRGEKTLGCCDRALRGASYPESGVGGDLWVVPVISELPTHQETGRYRGGHGTSLCLTVQRKR